jgi:hypothetical protein
LSVLSQKIRVGHGRSGWVGCGVGAGHVTKQ